MKAKVLMDYRCAPEGHTTIEFTKGQEVSGFVAQYLVDKEVAEEIKAEKPKIQKPKKTPKPKVAKKPKPKHEG